MTLSINPPTEREQLKARIAYLESRQVKMEQERRDLEDERDALAAHIEGLKPAIEAFCGGLGICRCGDSMGEHALGSGHYPVDSGWYALEQYMRRAPEVSLVRLIAERQRQALRQAAMRYKKYVTPANLRDFGDELVRQAEGGES